MCTLNNYCNSNTENVCIFNEFYFFRVVLTTLLESAKAYHECTVVFLTPGEYKIDIQCSTTEPIVDEVPHIKDTNQVPVQSCASEISHVWRFIPPVAISVTD